MTNHFHIGKPLGATPPSILPKESSGLPTGKAYTHLYEGKNTAPTEDWKQTMKGFWDVPTKSSNPLPGLNNA